MFDTLRALPQPTIASVFGFALGGGFELALNCDLIVASEDAYFQDLAHFVSNLSPGDGVHNIMPRVIGMNRFRYWQLMGQKITAQQAAVRADDSRHHGGVASTLFTQNAGCSPCSACRRKPAAASPAA